MEIELDIQQVGLMGQGVARDGQGNIYFVPGAIPGDRVLARVGEISKKYRDADLVRVQTPSPERRDPQCKVFDSCGGCDWLNWDYPTQVQAKDQVLRHVLERSEWMPETIFPPLAAANPYGYRNRIQLHVEGEQVGFYRRRSHHIVDVEDCIVAHPLLNQALADLRDKVRKGEMLLGKHKVEFAVQDGKVHRADDQPHAVAGFAQVNDAQNEILKARVREKILGGGAQRVLELYAGNGNLTFSYLDSVQQVMAVDSSAAALAQARTLLKPEAASRVAFLQADINGRLRRGLPRDFRERYDTLLLDPPRAGVQGCLESLLHDSLKTIVYVGCAPVAFTKDIQCLKDSFRFDEVQVIDMFPHTRHIEFIASFSRLVS